MALNTLTGFADLDSKQIEKHLLGRLLPQLRGYQDGQKSVLHKHSGQTIQFMGFDSLADGFSATVEGTVPTSEALSPRTVEAKVLQYIRTVQLTDVLISRGKHKCKAEAVRLLSEAGRKMIDTLIMNTLSTCTKEFCGNNKTKANITSADILKYSDIEKMFVYLSENNAVKFKDGTYHALITPKTAAIIRGMQQFIDKYKYQDPRGKGLLNGEIGKLGGFTFIETTNIKPVAAGANDACTCSQVFAYGEDAYGVVDMEAEGSNGRPLLISKGLGSAGTSDPGNQLASESVKFSFVAVILDNKRICKCIAPTTVQA